MRLEDYFDFIDSQAIRIKGTRVGIETVIRDYKLGATPEEIVIHYPTLTLEQVYATITYYLSHKSEIEAYINQVEERQKEGWSEQQSHPSEFVQELRERLERNRRLLRDQKDSTIPKAA